MKRYTKILSGDAVDLHGERMTLDALKGMKEQINTMILSSYIEHDYRNPPIARLVSADIRNDGKNNLLIGEVELFEIDDINRQNPIENRKMAIHENLNGQIRIGFDRSYELSGQIQEIKALQTLVDPEQTILYEMKKAVDPISCLTIFGAVVLGNIAAGFLNKIGSDVWDKIKKIFEKNPRTSHEKQIIFNITVQINKMNVESIVNFSEVDNAKIEEIAEMATSILESKLKQYSNSKIPVRRVVVNSDKNGTRHEYSVYSDGTPFDICNIEKHGSFIDEAKKRID